MKLTGNNHAFTLTDDVVSFWRSEIKVTAGRRDGEGIPFHVDAGA